MIDRPVVSALCRIFFTGVGVGAVSLRTGTLVENGALVKRRIVWLGVKYYGRGERMIFVHEVNDFKGEAIKAFDYVKTTLNSRRIPMTLKFGTKLEFPPLQAADVLACEGGKFVKNSTGKPRRAWTALDPDKTRLIVRRYAKDNMHELVTRLTNFREWLLANGWDGKAVA
jgi:hypothetical protein